MGRCFGVVVGAGDSRGFYSPLRRERQICIIDGGGASSCAIWCLVRAAGWGSERVRVGASKTLGVGALKALGFGALKGLGFETCKGWGLCVAGGGGGAS